MKKILLLLAICLGLSVQDQKACTSIIITGKATPDGRPLMWKHRDTEAPYNHIVYQTGSGYSYLGLVNSDDLSGAVWNGTNETGFSIMNTASFNLKDDDVKEMDQEGLLMRNALKVCKTVEDFEHYLDTLPRPLRTEANYGVIDAYGGAAYFETNNRKYYKKDANDPALAPDGYLIYTNFSQEGRKDEGLGYIRYETAKILFKAMSREGFTPQKIFKQASRSFYNSLMDIDLTSSEQSPNNRTGWFVEQDFIPRSESTASIVIQGVKPGMNPELTTMWTALGYPPTAIALPLWVKLAKEQPSLVLCKEGEKSAPLCLYASQLKEKVYSIHRGNGQRYLHWQLLWNKESTGYMQQLQPVEDSIFKLFYAPKAAWEKKNALPEDEIKQLYVESEQLIKAAYRAAMR
ncbi:MAG: hypothetical protein RRZ65_08255 [Tannerellaceae bacterium]